MGVVHVAQAPGGPLIALKTLRPDRTTEAFRARFARELQILRRLDHPGIARLLDHSMEDEPYFAMELVDGPRISDLARDRSLSLMDKLELLARIADVVAFAHEHGVIHRDLKPSNLLVLPEDASNASGPGRPKVLDFGVARVLDSSEPIATQLTEQGAFVGTIRYMSPEQLDGDSTAIDARTDVYSLAFVGYELLTGALPYDFSDDSLTRAVVTILRHPPRPLRQIDPSIPVGVEQVFSMALEKDPRLRYASIGELASDLRRVIEGRKPRAHASSIPRAMRVITRRRLAPLLLVLLVLAGIATWWRLAERQQVRVQLNALAQRMEDVDRIRNSAELSPSEMSAAILQYEQIRHDLASIPRRACTPLIESYALARIAELHFFLGEQERSPEELDSARSFFLESAAMRPARVDLSDIDRSRDLYGALNHPDQHFALGNVVKIDRMLAMYGAPVTKLELAVAEAEIVLHQRQSQLAAPPSLIPTTELSEALGYAFNELGGTLIELGYASEEVHPLDRALACFDAFDRLARQTDNADAVAATLFARGKAHLVRGELMHNHADLDSARSCYEASLGPDQPDARSIYRVKASLARVARVQARFTNLSGDRRWILDGAIALLGDGQRYLDREADRDDFHLSHMTEGMLWADRAEAGGGREDILRATSCYDLAGVVITADRFPIQYAELLRERGRAARIAWQLTRDEGRRTRAMEPLQTSLDLLPALQLPRHGRLAERELALLRADAR